MPLNTTKHGSLNIRPALLQNYRRHRVLHADYPAVVPCESSTVRGTLVSGLTDGDLWRLDIFEGNEYERKQVIVRELKYEGDIKVEPTPDQLGATVQAETYVWVSPKSDLEDNEWDFEEFVREKMWAWVGDSGEQRSDYKGEFEVRPSIRGRSFGSSSALPKDYDNLTLVDVDQAVEAKENESTDPTRGRGLNGAIGKALEKGRDKEEEIMKNAV
jgi:hypothetical protein